MRSLVAVITIAITVAGCQRSTGILPAGPDTYTVTERVAPILGGGEEAQRRALTEANAFCGQQSRQFVPVMMNQAGNLINPYGPTGYSVTFRCLLADDPAIAKYRLEAAPNFILEERSR